MQLDFFMTVVKLQLVENTLWTCTSHVEVQVELEVVNIFFGAGGRGRSHILGLG